MKFPSTSRRRVAAALLTGAVLGVTACGGGGGGGASSDGQVKGDRNTVNTTKVSKGGTATYTITYPISNWNVLNSQGATYSVLDISAVIAPDVFDIKPDGQPGLNEDLMVSAEKTGDSPQTVKYTINPDATWADGEPITADDLVYTWKANDPRYCPKCQASNTAGYDRIKSITPSDDGKTATIVFNTNYVDWQALFSPFLPAHVAKKYGDIETAAGLAESFNEGLAKNVPKWSAGPYRVTEFTSDGSVVMVPNEKWYGKTKPSLEKLVFRLVTDPAQQPSSLANGEVDVIYPNPQIDIVQQVEELPNVKYQVTPGSSVHMIWANMNAKTMTKPLRQAIFQAVSVEQVIDKTIGQFDKTAKPLKNHMFLEGAPGYTDVVSKYDYGVGDAEKAKKVLKDAGYTGIGEKLVDPDGKAVPKLRFAVQAGDKLRNSEAQIVKAAVDPLGIDIEIVSVPNTIDAVQEGNWSLTVGNVSESVFASTSNTAYYLSCPPKTTFCRFNIPNYGNPKVDTLMKQAISAKTSEEAIKKLQEADDLVSADYAVLPLYNNRTFLAYNGNLGNVRENSVAFPTYNTDQWGFIEKPGD